MAIDNNQDYKEIKSKIGAYKKTIKSKKDTAQKKKDELGDNFAKSQEKHFSNLNEWGDTAQAYTDEKKKLIKDTVTSQLDQLTEIFMISAKEGEGEGSQYETTQKLTQLYNDTILSTKSKIAELWIQEGIKAIGCSEEQTYELNDIYIRVESIDLFKTLKDGPNESPSNLRYERFNTANGTIPFSMNRELFERTQNAGRRTYYRNHFCILQDKKKQVDRASFQQHVREDNASSSSQSCARRRAPIVPTNPKWIRSIRCIIQQILQLDHVRQQGMYLVSRWA